jgi:hypothetical protein
MKQKWSVPAGTLQQHIVDQPFPRDASELFRRFETRRRLDARRRLETWRRFVARLEAWRRLEARRRLEAGRRSWGRLGLRHNFAGHSDKAGKHDGSEQTERPSTVRYLHQIFLHWAARLGDAIAFKTIRTLRTETAAAANRPRPSRTK